MQGFPNVRIHRNSRENIHGRHLTHHHYESSLHSLCASCFALHSSRPLCHDSFAGYFTSASAGGRQAVDVIAEWTESEDTKPVKIMVPGDGVEPPTRGFSVPCSITDPAPSTARTATNAATSTLRAPGEAARIHSLSQGSSTAESLTQFVDAFLLSRRIANCTAETLRTYETHLRRLARSVSDPTPGAVGAYLHGLRDTMRPISVHKHYRTLRSFFGWAVEAGLLAANPLRGVTMRLPKTLPHVPEDQDVRRLLGACSDATFEGRRNRALISLLVDGGLRISEALRLRLEDVNFAARTLLVRSGKGAEGRRGVLRRRDGPGTPRVDARS